MTSIKDTERQVAIGYSRTLTGGGHGDWNSYHRRDGKIHRMTLYDTYVIPDLHKILFSMMQVLKKGFQVTPESKSLILREIMQRFILAIKWRTKAAKDLH